MGDVRQTILKWNQWRWYIRLPVKWAIFALASLIVCFPYPGRLIRHIQHWQDPNALTEPDNPALQPWADEFRSSLEEGITPQQTLREVEKFVYHKVPYDWDWNTWGMADYLPTVDEVIEMGREDCDGQAVVAASLLRSLGMDAQLVGNFAHVWVTTSHGEAMGPLKDKAIVVTDQGVKFQAAGFKRLPRYMGFGVAVFPLLRELILIAVLWILCLHERASWGRRLCSLTLLAGGLMMIRSGGENFREPTVWLELFGLCSLLVGIAWLLLPWWNTHDSTKSTGFLAESANT